MKAVFVSYNQALTDPMQEILDDLNDLLDALAVIKVSQLKKGPHA